MDTLQNKKETAARGISHLLDSLKTVVQSKESVFGKIELVMTLGNRISKDVGAKTLTLFQSSFIARVADASDATYTEDCVRQQGKVTYVLAAKPYGRIIIEKIDEYQGRIESELNKNTIYGYIHISEQLHAEIMGEAKTSEQRELEGIDTATKYMQSLSRNELEEMLDFVEHTHRCMAPIIYYIEDKTFSNFYGFAKAEGGQDVFLSKALIDLKNKELQYWDKYEISLIFSLYFLLNSGPHTRPEEFNSQQISPARLESYFDAKCEWYLHQLHGVDRISYASEYKLADIPNKAMLLKNFRDKLAHEYLFYREVNGLNLHKIEKMAIKSEVGGRLVDLPVDLKNYFTGTFGVDTECFSDSFLLFKAITEIALEKSFSRTEQDLLSPLEELVHTIVSSAILNTNSEIGMTRGLRRFHEIIRLQQNGNIEEAFAWPQTNYFCYVVPCEEIINKIPGKHLLGILNAISARMRFNSWHYLPGNFARSEIPEKRDYYIPPKMPDTAVWSDQHHPGHIHTAVRNSIRSPSSISINGKNYLAFFDLRLMRRDGDAYTKNDLMLAVQYTNYLRFIYQVVMDNLAMTNREYDFVFGTKAWYQAYYTDTNKSEELKYA